MSIKSISKKATSFVGKSLLGGMIAGTVGLTALSLSTKISPTSMFWNYTLSFPKDEVVINAKRGHTLWGYGWQIRNACYKDPIGLRDIIGPSVNDVANRIYDSNPLAFTRGLKEEESVRIPIFCDKQFGFNVPPGVDERRSLYNKK